MAHFAEIDENNKVIRVIVVSDEDCKDKHGVEKEAIGVYFCKTLFGPETEWKQTSYNRSMRKHYAGVGYTYDAAKDAFIPPQPFPSWVLDDATCDWSAPVPFPTDGKDYSWDEATKSWKLFEGVAA